MKVLIGYFIRRTARDAHALRGKTFSAYAHRLFAERRQADDALARDDFHDWLDARKERRRTLAATTAAGFALPTNHAYPLPAQRRAKC